MRIHADLGDFQVRLNASNRIMLRVATGQAHHRYHVSAAVGQVLVALLGCESKNKTLNGPVAMWVVAHAARECRRRNAPWGVAVWTAPWGAVGRPGTSRSEKKQRHWLA